MKKKHFSVEQITAVLKQAEAARPSATSVARSAFRANVLSLEESVRRDAAQRGARAEAAARRERAPHRRHLNSDDAVHAHKHWPERVPEIVPGAQERVPGDRPTNSFGSCDLAESTVFLARCRRFFVS